MNRLQAAVGHFKTIKEHRRVVRQECFKLGLYYQGLTHDLSKYSPIEFRTGVLYYQGDRSPNAAEREEKGYSLAWLHHKGRNMHHFEFWQDIALDKSQGIIGNKMPLRYVAEMYCDRLAACKIYQKDKYTQWSPWNYYCQSAKYLTIHPDTRRLLEKLLYMTGKYGEEKTFRYLRYLLKVKKSY